MSDGEEPTSPSDLTGYWSGEYWYNAGAGTLAQFAAHIQDGPGGFEGTTLETANFGIGLVELSAAISGSSRDAAAVEFVKRYDPGQRVHRLPIFYAGAINSELTQIDGIWTLSERGERLSGGFRMLRGSGGPKAAVKREAREPVLADVGGRTKPADAPSKTRRK